MTDTFKLERAIRESGLNKGYLAEELRISRQAFRNKVVNKSEFKASEIEILCNLLKLKAQEKRAIFFATNVDR